MKIRIQSAKIIDPNSPFNGQTKSLLIENGIIIAIENEVTEDADQLIECENLHISPGLFDLRTHLCEPGFEQHEDLESGMNAAAKGGFTGIAIMPNTYPSISSRTQVEYIVNKGNGAIVDIKPIGSITANLEGKELSELYDMHQSGAVAFSDDKHSFSNAGMLSRALLYAKNFNGLVLSFPYDKTVAHNGQINEGITSTNLGLEGIPALSEELHVARDLYLAQYNNTRIHLGPLSSKGSVDLIKSARQSGVEVSCDIAAHQLVFTDEACSDFDTNFKVLPPFRTKEHQNSLIEGLKDNTIDIISSDHTPYDVEEKLKEFDLANFGIINLQTAFPIALTYLEQHIGLDGIISKMSINPRKVLGLEVPTIAVGSKATITLFNPKEKWTFVKSDIASKSYNTPFVGSMFTGKVKGIINNNQLVLVD
jgi:dihydroorotase